MDDTFLQGHLYANTTGIPRATCCETCAFREGPSTVRPPGVSIADVQTQADDCYDFVCHTANSDGTYPSCAGFVAYQRNKGKDHATS